MVCISTDRRNDEVFIRALSRCHCGGNQHQHRMCGAHGYMHGGAGYWLGTRAMEIITNAKQDCISEDGWVANKLADKGIEGQHDPRYTYTRLTDRTAKFETPTKQNSLIAVAEFAPKEFVQVQRCWKESFSPVTYTQNGVTYYGDTALDKMPADEYKRRCMSINVARDSSPRRSR